MPRLTQDETHPVRFTLNGRPVSARVSPRTLLTDVLRQEIGATGTHVGCEHGVCGACTVQIDGEPARACLMLAHQAEGCELRTVEGLATDDALSSLQEAFREHFALQCGFCTPGMIMTGVDMVNRYKAEGRDLTAQAIRHELEGNICRCTGYHNIVRAVEDAAAKM